MIARQAGPWLCSGSTDPAVWSELAMWFFAIASVTHELSDTESHGFGLSRMPGKAVLQHSGSLLFSSLWLHRKIKRRIVATLARDIHLRVLLARRTEPLLLRFTA